MARTASRDFTEFLTGILAELMDFKRGKLERCLVVHESNETHVVSHVDDPVVCAEPTTLEKFWTQITKFVINRGEALNSRLLVTEDSQWNPLPNTWTNAKTLFNDALDGTDEFESAR